MVRFIICIRSKIRCIWKKIYIPIWLDLLSFFQKIYIVSSNGYLHSNMVRFIITTGFMSRGVQINLHSNMVRFIIRRSK